jgi:hypothetical protein
MIPPILHLTWKTKELPSHFQRNVDTWKKVHPEFQVIIYDDDDLRELVKTHYPQFLEAYDSFEKQINRVDFARLAMLAKHGGVYSDMDAFPLKRLDDLLESQVPVFAEEAQEHSEKLYQRSGVVCNALMLSPPTSERWWLGLMEFIVSNYSHSKKDGVVNSTGPMILTKYLDNPSIKSQVTVLSACAFFPLLDGTNSKLGKLPPPVPTEYGDVYVSRACDLRDAYAVHLWDHSWFFTPDKLLRDPFNLAVWVVLILAFLYLLWKTWSERK